MPPTYLHVRDLLSPIAFRSNCVQAGDRNDRARNGSCRRHSDTDGQIRSLCARETCRGGRQVVGVPVLHVLPQLVERGADDRQIVDVFVFADSLVVGITQQRVTLSVIVVQVVLVEHLRVHISHQHVRDEA